MPIREITFSDIATREFQCEHRQQLSITYRVSVDSFNMWKFLNGTTLPKNIEVPTWELMTPHAGELLFFSTPDGLFLGAGMIRDVKYNDERLRCGFSEKVPPFCVRVHDCHWSPSSPPERKNSIMEIREWYVQKSLETFSFENIQNAQTKKIKKKEEDVVRFTPLGLGDDDLLFFKDMLLILQSKC